MAKRRTMTDVEVGLVRAMLAKGMKNDQVHFYFNRVDRLISSGRIAQIRKAATLKTSVEAVSGGRQAQLWPMSRKPRRGVICCAINS